jgi:hypothetical protein
MEKPSGRSPLPDYLTDEQYRYHPAAGTIAVAMAGDRILCSTSLNHSLLKLKSVSILSAFMPENMRSRSLKARKSRKYSSNRLLRFLRYWYIRLVRLQGHPREIARGFALEVFSGFFPWYGPSNHRRYLLATLFRANKIAVALVRISAIP